MSPWIWVPVITAIWLAAAILGLALCKAASDADDLAARMYADDCPDDDCPDELEP